MPLVYNRDNFLGSNIDGFSPLSAYLEHLLLWKLVLRETSKSATTRFVQIMYSKFCVMFISRVTTSCSGKQPRAMAILIF